AAPTLAPARWNRALALQALDLSLTAAAALDVVAARGEPGWSEEARTRAGALHAAMASRARDHAQYLAAVDAMHAGGPPVAPELARRHPGPARRDLLDAIVLAGSADAVRALAPLARALDDVAHTDHATRAVAAAAARDFAVRRRFHDRFRALIDGKLDGAATSALIGDLARAGAAAADILEVVVLGTAPSAADLARLRARPADDDPWFAIRFARRDGELRIAAGDSFGAEVALLAAMPACRDPAWWFACGYVDRDLGDLYLRMRRLDEADLQLRAARTAYASSGAPAHEDFMLQHQVNLERLRGRDALAQAYLDEILLRGGGRCEIARFVDESRVAIAHESGDMATAQHGLAAGPPRCAGPPDVEWVMAAVDLARLGDAADRARVMALLDTIGTASRALRVAASIGRGRLTMDGDPAGGAALVREGLAGVGGLADVPGTAGELRVWGHSALIGDAGRRADWSAAIAVFADELGAPAPAGCLVAVSTDYERATAVVRGSDGTVRGSHRTGRSLTSLASDTLIPPALSAALAGCPAIAVIARPPLHGRDDLLPPQLPWSFVGAPHAAGTSLPPRRVAVSDPRPPASLGLPPLPAVAVPGATQLTGTAATPAQVLAELRSATYVEIHAHGLVDLAASDTAFIALSPGVDGRFALTAAQVRAVRLDGGPIVVLGACHAATGNARLIAHRWSLPDAFLAAGARTVIAASTAILDDPQLFGELRARLDRGEPPAQAVAALRAARVAAGQRWAAGLMVFE
ncbi:MAG: CHAT domain-containing protein, partial [Deltaproteobacteria bacterium]